MNPVTNPDSLFELMDRLTENSVAITQVAATLGELNSRLNITNNNLEKFTEEIRKTLADHETRIVDVEHNCRKESSWDRAWSRLDNLEQAEMQRVGAKQYEITRINNIEEDIKRGDARLDTIENELKSHLDSSGVKEKIEDKREDRTQEYILFIAGMIGTLVVGYILAKFV